MVMATIQRTQNQSIDVDLELSKTYIANPCQTEKHNE